MKVIKEQNNYSKSPIISVINNILSQAIEMRASDVHIDPFQEKIIIRFRIDGILEDNSILPKFTHSELLARVKIISGLRTDEHFHPQDGRFKFDFGKGECDIRVSIIPTYYGENIVMRILTSQIPFRSFVDLGLGEKNTMELRKALCRNGGMVVVSGPTGSGKSTTLYSIINYLREDKKSIVTIEDPIEYALDKVRQIPVGSKYGIGFPDVLRSVLRQDPDIIMVGEIRDRETASIAVNASLTGHMLITSLHTKDAVSVIPRLLDMGIERFLLSSTISLVIAQRLVRKKKADGYEGRIGIYEFLPINQTLRNMIRQGSSTDDILVEAKNSGFKTIYEHGLEKVDKDETTIEEVLRVINE